MANRIWHHVFGSGIVRTADNFGRMGETPSHPELLDWLAKELLRRGWSLKGMLKLLLTSETFATSDDESQQAQTLDPQNRLLTHWSLRRLEAEAIRDNMLQLSGALELGSSGEPVGTSEPRRSVFTRIIRNSLDPLLTVFDAPVPSSTRGVRDVTNVPAQALALLNSSQVQRWARDWAKQQHGEIPDRVRHMIQQAYAREATEAEVTQSVAYLARMRKSVEAKVGDLAEIQARLDETRQKISSIIEPARKKLAEGNDARSREQAPSLVSSIPPPAAEWDFEKDTRDITGNGLDLKLHGGARIGAGALVLNGDGSMASTGPLPFHLKTKTLQVWLQLDDLAQSAGGAMTVQDTRGVVFDSIVWAEKEAGRWIVGSDNHSRTTSLQAPEEMEAAKRMIQLTYTWDSEGTVTAYRDGEPYGKPIHPSAFVTFKKGESQILLGCRHGSPSGNRLLKGRIHRARLYKAALTAKEVKSSLCLENTGPTESDVIATLAQDASRQLQLAKSRAEVLEQQLRATRDEVVDLSAEDLAWQSLAMAYLNAKEFIFLR
jgi:hypothetical protein